MTTNRKVIILLGSLFLFILSAQAEDSRSRGRYLTIIAGCNDCHTSDFAQKGGNIPESEWLKGDALGWNGPWGTSYAINLRSLVSKISKKDWLLLLKNSKARPPMPSYVFQTMSESDMQAIYDFIHSLGPATKEVPAALPPGEVPKTPYIRFDPVIP